METANLDLVVDKVVEYTLNMDLTWDWPCGVAYYGVSRAYEVTGNENYLNRMEQWCNEYIEVGLPIWTVNTCSMGHMLISLYKQTNNQKYLDIILQKINYIQHEALRFGDHVLQHTVSAKNDFPEQCWADTLFMAAYFQLRVGVLLQEKHLIEDALHQFYWHINFLQNELNGLWYHGYSHVAKNHMSGIYWGRANAWAAYTMSRVKHVLPEPYLYPHFMHIDSSLRDQLATLKTMQRADGLWGTVLDYEKSYTEVSASSGIAAAMVMQGNPLHSKYVQKALEGILANIAENGKVQNVSAGTAVMNNIEGYLEIPKKWAQGWGQGLALAFLSAVMENERIIGMS